MPAVRLFRRLALAGALLAATVVVLGAWVRLTAAGLGCPDWPGCFGHVFPDAAQPAQDFGRALREMVHRYAATTLGLVCVALFALSVVNRRVAGQPRAAPLALLVVVCLQGALGALTVTLRLTPLVVTAHLLGGLTTLGLLRWLSIAPPAPPQRAAAAQHDGLRVLAGIGGVLLAVQVALGGWTSANYAATACPDAPTCQRAWWPAMDWHDGFRVTHGPGLDYEGGVLALPARTAIQVAHRIGAVTAGGVLLLVAAGAWREGRTRRLRALGLLLGAAVCTQAGIGIASVVSGMPLALATLHNAGAALLVVTMVTLLRELVPLRDVEPARQPSA